MHWPPNSTFRLRIGTLSSLEPSAGTRITLKPQAGAMDPDLVDAAPSALPVAFRLMAVTLMALQRLPDELLGEQADIQLLREAVIDIDRVPV